MWFSHGKGSPGVGWVEWGVGSREGDVVRSLTHDGPFSTETLFLDSLDPKKLRCYFII